MANAWTRNHPWAVVYDALAGRPLVGRVAWQVALNSDIRVLYRAVEEIGTLPTGAAVLDLPCGGGVALRGVRPGQELRYVAADIAPDQLARTQAEADKRGVTIETAREDAAALTFADATFDLAVCFTSLHCFPDPAGSVAELGRVVRPGGVLSGSTLTNDNGLRYLPMRVGGRLGGLLGPGGTGADVRHWLADAGFVDVALDRSGGMTYFRGRRA